MVPVPKLGFNEVLAKARKFKLAETDKACRFCNSTDNLQFCDFSLSSLLCKLLLWTSTSARTISFYLVLLSEHFLGNL